MMRNLLVGIALVALVALGVFGWRAVDVDWQVHVVRVEGQLQQAEKVEVQRRIEQVLQGGLLSLDVTRLREQVLALSWPDKVSVRKVWPHTIVVRVTPKRVVARWADDGYLTSAGDILKTPNGPLDVPVFNCALSNSRKALEVYRGLQRIAEEQGLVIDGVIENEIGEWQLTVSRGPIGYARVGNDAPVPADARSSLTLMLGADHMRKRLERFLVAWSRRLSRHADNLDYADLRYGNGIAVRWRRPDTQHAGATTTQGAKETT